MFAVKLKLMMLHLFFIAYQLSSGCFVYASKLYVCSEIKTHPLDYVSAISTKAVIRYCFLTRYEFKKNYTKTINITLVSKLLGNIVPIQSHNDKLCG